MLILLLADVATTEDALWAVVVFVVAVVAVVAEGGVWRLRRALSLCVCVCVLGG